MVKNKHFSAGRSSSADFDLDVGTLVETGRAPYKLLQSLVGRLLEGLDHLNLLTINGNGLVVVL